VTAIKAGGATASGKPELAWQLKRSAAYVPTGIVKDGLLWLWSDAGVVSCLRAQSGEVLYQERVGGNYFGSPIWVDGRLFCVSKTGELVVLEASDKFNVLHRFPLKELCHTTPAVANNRLFIRTEKTLWCFGRPAAAVATP
jgi:outer membrane protein assembly factor BamB